MPNLQGASSIDLASLAMRARDAYDQKRTKECLTLTKSLLMADPENVDAKSLQRAIRSDIQRNLDDARALLEDSRRHDNLQEHRKAAEILLLKILYLDPEHEEAKTLLNSGKAASQATISSVAAAAQTAAAPAPAPIPFPTATPTIDNSVEPVFAVEYRRVEKAPIQKSRTKVPLILAASVLVAGVLIVTAQSRFRKTSAPTQPAPVAAVMPAAKPPEVRKDIVPVSNQNPYTETAVPELVPKNSQPSTPKEVPAPSATVIATPPTPVAPVVTGTLAVNSPISTEIYQGDKFLGSTPATLELPAGTYALEYRHGDFRQTVTHVVKAKETTTAMVTFDVTVQINARPWAQVFLDGAQRRPLGQTPLSDIKVPIGSSLVFENPNFPAKTYRVTGKETAIQIAFP
jgi:hypothetical protein